MGNEKSMKNTVLNMPLDGFELLHLKNIKFDNFYFHKNESKLYNKNWFVKFLIL